MRTLDCDVLIAGSGIAGLVAALRLCHKKRVLVLAKKSADETNTNFAQGGISCVQEPDDSFAAHLADTLDAGAGLCQVDAARHIVEQAPACIGELARMGVAFATSSETASGYSLGREGGHTARRILHAGDITGRQIQTALLARVREQDAPTTILEQASLIDVVTSQRLGLPGPDRVVGAYALARENGEVFAIRAPHVVLATGGAGKIYLYTSNPDVATGDGVAIGWRAGARVANMEFIQFHPTCLFHPKAKNFLVSEAVRGEGAELVDLHGKPFMHRYDPRGSLAPRDIVARAMDSEMKRTAAPYCCLDIRHKSQKFLRERFPNIYAKALEFGIDMACDLVPVVPAAHYCCGGVQADTAGRTSMPGLYAIGETACTGFHGANRLASNSLLEAVSTALDLSRVVLENPLELPENVAIPDWHPGSAVPDDEAVMVAHNWQEIRTAMWDYVGIVRTDRRLARALRRIEMLRDEIRAYYFDHLVTPDILELRNLADTAWLIIRSAMQRKESRGLHYTLDYPNRLPEARDTVIEGRGR